MRPDPAWITVAMGGLDYRLLLDVPAHSTAEATNALAAAVVAGVQTASMEIASLRDEAGRSEAACWLQDPDKGDHGWGLRFASLADLWRDMPSLRPVSWDGGRLIVESFSIGQARS